MEEIYSLIRTSKMVPWICYFSFKKYIWDLANSFRDHVFQISFRVMNFQDIYPQLWKEILETYTPYNQILILIFKEQLCVSGMDFCILYWQGKNSQCGTRITYLELAGLRVNTRVPSRLVVMYHSLSFPFKAIVEPKVTGQKVDTYKYSVTGGNKKLNLSLSIQGSRNIN